MAAGDNERASNEWIRAQKNPAEACIAYSYVYTMLFCVIRNPQSSMHLQAVGMYRWADSFRIQSLRTEAIILACTHL
jgi:hypothetical protein